MKTETENKLLNLVDELIRADDNREDTAQISKAIRTMFVDDLGRKDPLGMMEIITKATNDSEQG